MSSSDQQKKKEKELAASVKKLISDIDNDPQNSERYYALGMLLTKSAQYEPAEELFKRTINYFENEHLPTDLLQYGLGNVFYTAGMYQDSLRVFQKISDKRLKNDAYLMIAQNYYAQGNYQQALVFALTVSEQSLIQQQMAAWSLVGESLMALGNLKLAADYFDRVLKQKPNEFKTNFDRGVIEMVLHRDAKKYFEIAEQIDPLEFKRKQQRLTDIERVLVINQHKQQGEKKGAAKSDPK